MRIAKRHCGLTWRSFNVGANIDLEVPQRFWSALAGKYGNKFFWRDNGETAAIKNAVSNPASQHTLVIDLAVNTMCIKPSFSVNTQLLHALMLWSLKTR